MGYLFINLSIVELKISMSPLYVIGREYKVFKILSVFFLSSFYKDHRILYFLIYLVYNGNNTQYVEHLENIF